MDINLSIQALVNTPAGPTQLSPTSLAKTLTVFERKNQILGLGNNAIVVPKNSLSAVIVTYCLILFDPTNNPTSVYTLKGVNGDTGIVFHATDPFALIPVSGDFVISSSHADTFTTEFIFF